MFKRDGGDRSTPTSAAKVIAIVIFVLAVRAATQLRGVRGVVLVSVASATVVVVFTMDAWWAAIRRLRRPR